MSGIGESLGVHGTVDELMLTILLKRGLGQPDKLMCGVKGWSVKRRDDRLDAEIMSDGAGNMVSKGACGRWKDKRQSMTMPA
jgi:hypothetical protein